jgi:hypothetical protein
MPYIPKQRSHSTYSSVILIATQSKHSLYRTTLPARYIHYHYHFARKSWSYILRDRSTQFTPMQHFSGNTLPIVYFEKFEHITFKIDQKIFW